MENHCRKCGRRSRKHDTSIRIDNDRFKCQRQQQRLFLTEFPLYSAVTQTNSNHSKSNNRNVIIDQSIEVQEVNATNNQNYENDEYRRFPDRLKRAQQMIYLRENINNLTYREIHFPNEYVIAKRLEEKNHLIHQNRFSVDHHYRPLKLEYRTISTSFQNIPVTSFTYSKEDPSIAHPFDENHSVLPTTVEMNDTTSTDRTDSPILDKPYQEFKHQNYSQNAVQSIFETAVIVDVRKCPQVTRHHSPIQLHWNHVIPTWSTSLLKNTQQPETRSFSRSQNSNQTSLQQIPKISSQTTCSPPNITRNYLSDISSSIKYTETLQKLKQILDVLQQHLLKRSPALFNEIDQSTSIAMTSDSLATTYSVSSTIPISQIEVDSLNKNYYSNRIKLRNSAKNINCNQQISDDEKTENFTQSPPQKSMSSSFMFVLQILLVLCLIDRIIVLTENFLSTTVDDSRSITPISSAFVKKTKEIVVSGNNEKFLNYFSLFLNQKYSFA